MMHEIQESTTHQKQLLYLNQLKFVKYTQTLLFIYLVQLVKVYVNWPDYAKYS